MPEVFPTKGVDGEKLNFTVNMRLIIITLCLNIVVSVFDVIS